MRVHRTSISIPESLWLAAQPRISQRHCNGFSDYVADLIKEDVREAEKRKLGLISTTVFQGVSATDDVLHGQSDKNRQVIERTTETRPLQALPPPDASAEAHPETGRAPRKRKLP